MSIILFSAHFEQASYSNSEFHREESWDDSFQAFLILADLRFVRALQIDVATTFRIPWCHSNAHVGTIALGAFRRKDIESRIRAIQFQIKVFIAFTRDSLLVKLFPYHSGAAGWKKLVIMPQIHSVPCDTHNSQLVVRTNTELIYSRWEILGAVRKLEAVVHRPQEEWLRSGRNSR